MLVLHRNFWTELPICNAFIASSIFTPRLGSVVNKIDSKSVSLEETDLCTVLTRNICLRVARKSSTGSNEAFILLLTNVVLSSLEIVILMPSIV